MSIFRNKKIKTGQTIVRYTIDVVIAGIILYLLTMILAAIGGLGIIATTLFTIIVAVYYVPLIFKKHPGRHSFLDLIVGIVVGSQIVALMSVLFGVTLPALTTLGGTPFNFLLGITSFWLADTIVLKVMKKM